MFDLTSDLQVQQGTSVPGGIAWNCGESTYKITTIELDLDMDIDARRDVLAGVCNNLDGLHVLVFFVSEAQSSQGHILSTHHIVAVAWSIRYGRGPHQRPLGSLWGHDGDRKRKARAKRDSDITVSSCEMSKETLQASRGWLGGSTSVIVSHGRDPNIDDQTAGMQSWGSTLIVMGESKI